MRIKEALNNSRKLVVIISDEMLEDQQQKFYDNNKSDIAQCYLEILDFLTNPSHIPDDIIPVYIGEKRDIKDIIPSILLKEGAFIHNEDNSGNVIPLEYWNARNILIVNDLVNIEKEENRKRLLPARMASLIFKNAEKRKNEENELYRTVASKIAASIFGMDSDQFITYQNAEKKKAKLKIAVGIIVAAIIIIALVVFLVITSNAYNLAEARQSLSDGNRKEALNSALRAKSTLVFKAELSRILWEAMDPSTPYLTFDSDVAISRKTNEFAVIRDDQYIDIYDFTTLSIIKTYDVGHGFSLRYSPNGNKLAIFSKRNLTIIDRDTDHLIRKDYNGADIDVNAITNVHFSQNGNYIYCDGIDEAYKLPNLVKQPISILNLPYSSYSILFSACSFLGTDDKLSIVTKAYIKDTIRRKSSPDTLWSISVYDLTKKARYNKFSRRIANSYLEMSDSVSLVGAYSDQPFFYYSTPHKVNFIQLKDSLLIDSGGRRFDLAITQMHSWSPLVSEWNHGPKHVVASKSDKNGNNFILTDKSGIKYGLNYLHEVKILTPGREEAGVVSFYNNPILAIQDTLILFNDSSGYLYLRPSAQYNYYGESLSGIRLENDAEYTIQEYDGFQFVTEICKSVTGKVFKTVMYIKHDLRELPIPINKEMWWHYISPDLRYALVSFRKEYGIYLFENNDFIPVCSSRLYSSCQDYPWYKDGEILYLIVPKTPSDNCDIKYDLLTVNLTTKKIKVLFSGIDDFSSPLYNGYGKTKTAPLSSNDIVCAQRNGKTFLIDLRRPKEIIEEYPGILDIQMENGFFSVKRKEQIYGSKNAYSVSGANLLYNSSIYLMPIPISVFEEDDSVDYYTTPNSKYLLKKHYKDGIIKYTLLNAKSLSPIVDFTSNKNPSLYGISSNERFFYFERNNVLVIYDLEKRREIQTNFDIDRERIDFVAVSDNLLFFPGNQFKVIDLTNGNAIMSLPELNFERSIAAISFSPNERWLLAGKYLMDIANQQIMCRIIPVGYERILTNEYIVYNDRVIALPQKHNLVTLAKHAQVR